MKKIGILTFHRSLNYGAFIQAYSLYKRIERDFPNVQVEIIDYAVKRIQNKYSTNPFVFTFSSLKEMKRYTIIPTCKVTMKNAYTVLFNREFLKKRKKMRSAFDKCLKSMKLSERSFCTDNLSEISKYVTDNYDAVIVGSDCVWEIRNYPFPNVYFLNEVNNVHKLSYAACAQGILYKNITESQKKYMRESWNKFEYMGVRDSATENLIGQIDKSLKIKHNCDPTVFLDVDKIPVDMDKLKKKFEDAGVDFSKPTICLMANEYLGKTCREAMGDKYQIVAVYEENRYADCFVFDLTPFEWARCFSLFDLVFTNRFHGTILAFQNKANVLTFDYFAQSSNYSNNGMTKMRDLYERLGCLENHYFIGKHKFNREEIDNIRQVAEKIVNSNEADIIYEALNREALAYDDFCNALKECLK